MPGDTQYTNPFQMFMNTNQPQGGVPFAAQWEGQENRDLARPFIDRLNQRDQLETMKHQMETGEFMGAEAQGVRSQERRAKGAEAQSKIDTLPYKSMADIEAEKQRLRELPHMTDARIETAKETVRKAQGTPYAQLFDELGTAYPAMEGKSEVEKAAIHQGIIQNWEAKNPGLRAPDRMRAYSPQHDADYALLHHQQLNTPDYLRKLQLEGRQQASAERIGTDHDTASIEVGAGHDRAHIAGMTRQLEASETPPRAIARLKRELRTNPTNEDAANELQGYLDKEFRAQYAHDVRGQMLATQAMNNDPEAIRAYQAHTEKERYKYLRGHQLFGEMSSASDQWVFKMIDANPNADVNTIVKAGKKTGKIK